MELTGLGLSVATSLAAALAGAIAILYLLKLRRRRVTVPFGSLWSRVLLDKQASSWLQRLKRLLSYLLWVFLVWLLVAALTDPQPEREIERGKNIVVMLDTSASMAAVEPEQGGRSRFHLAQEKVRGLIDEMGPHDKMMIIAVDGQVRSVTGELSGQVAVLRDALDGLSPTATEARILDGFRTAVDVLSGRPEPHLYLVSDGAFGELRLPERLLRAEITFKPLLVGEATGNIAISAFNIRRYLANKLDYEVFVQVTNYFDVPVFAELTLYNLLPDANQPSGFFYKIIEKRTLELGPGASELRFYEDLALASDQLAARVSLKSEGLRDVLPLDDEAFVMVPRFRQARVLCVTPGNLFLEAALLLNENLRVDFMRPSDPFLRPDGGEIRLTGLRERPYDVVIFDNSYWEPGTEAIAPAAEVAGNYLYLNPKGTASPFSVRDIREPLIERVDRKHPLARWLSLKDINILRGSRINTQGGDRVVVRSIDGPLIVARRDGGVNAIAVGFSLVESDLVFRVALPVFLINAIDWFMDESGSLIQGYRTGENWHIPVPSGVQAVHITNPAGRTDRDIPTHQNRVIYYGALTGFYRMESSQGPSHSWTVAANFSSPRESDLRRAVVELAAQDGVRATTVEAAASDPRLDKWAWIFSHFERDLWLYAVYLVLGLLVVEWFTYHRRWTV